MVLSSSVEYIKNSQLLAGRLQLQNDTAQLLQGIDAAVADRSIDYQAHWWLHYYVADTAGNPTVNTTKTCASAQNLRDNQFCTVAVAVGATSCPTAYSYAAQFVEDGAGAGVIDADLDCQEDPDYDDDLGYGQFVNTSGLGDIVFAPFGDTFVEGAQRPLFLVSPSGDSVVVLARRMTTDSGGQTMGGLFAAYASYGTIPGTTRVGWYVRRGATTEEVTPVANRSLLELLDDNANWQQLSPQTLDVKAWSYDVYPRQDPYLALASASKAIQQMPWVRIRLQLNYAPTQRDALQAKNRNITVPDVVLPLTRTQQTNARVQYRYPVLGLLPTP